MTRVFALRYAYRTESQRGEHFYGHVPDCCGSFPIDYFTWAVLTDTRTVVIDAGFTPETAEERGDRPHLGSPAELLRDLGRSPEDVTDLVLTHLHYDHTGYIAMYPNARIWVQRSELEFWSSATAQRGAFKPLVNVQDLRLLHQLTEADRVTPLDGDADLGEGITIHHVGGHTPGMQVVRVEGGNRPVVLASDASHFYANIEDDHPYGIVYHLDDMYRAFDRVKALAGDSGFIVPGHDPQVTVRHSSEPGHPDLIFRLDA